jgi:hypothetical protein
MIPAEFKEQYGKELGAGNNPNTGSLPRVVCIDPRAPGVAVSLSCWELAPQELEEVKQTGKIWIGVMCSKKNPTQPPIYALGCNPLELGIFTLVPEEDVKHLGDE